MPFEKPSEESFTRAYLPIFTVTLKELNPHLFDRLGNNEIKQMITEALLEAYKNVPLNYVISSGFEQVAELNAIYQLALSILMLTKEDDSDDIVERLMFISNFCEYRSIVEICQLIPRGYKKSGEHRVPFVDWSCDIYGRKTYRHGYEKGQHYVESDCQYGEIRHYSHDNLRHFYSKHFMGNHEIQFDARSFGMSIGSLTAALLLCPYCIRKIFWSCCMLKVPGETKDILTALRLLKDWPHETPQAFRFNHKIHELPYVSSVDPQVAKTFFLMKREEYQRILMHFQEVRSITLTAPFA